MAEHLLFNGNQSTLSFEDIYALGIIISLDGVVFFGRRGVDEFYKKSSFRQTPDRVGANAMPS
jgi:hypothetical protein